MAMGNRSARSTVWEIAKYVLVAAAVAWLLTRGAGRLTYHWQWYRIPGYLLDRQDGVLTIGPLLQGLWVTLKVTAVSLLLSLACGLTTALLRLSDSALGRWLARGYLELIRNTPLLVQLFFIYFVLAPVLDLGGFVSAVLALSLFEGAYMSEIFRAGIVSIPKGQWEAAFSIGLGRYHTYRLVILPQAARRTIPPLTGQIVSLVKDSALVSTIAIYDLSMQAQAIIAETYLVFEIWLVVAAIYLAITMSLSTLTHALEQRWKVDV